MFLKIVTKEEVDGASANICTPRLGIIELCTKPYKLFCLEDPSSLYFNSCGVHTVVELILNEPVRGFLILCMYRIDSTIPALAASSSPVRLMHYICCYARPPVASITLYVCRLAQCRRCDSSKIKIVPH